MARKETAPGSRRTAEAGKKVVVAKNQEDLVLAAPLGKNQQNLLPVRTYSGVVAGILCGTLR